VNEAVKSYESQLEWFRDSCVDPWFALQLAKCRQGDEDAWRRICESCVRVVLDIAKEKCGEDNPRLLDVVQQGNQALASLPKSFSGSTAEQFLAELSAALNEKLGA